MENQVVGYARVSTEEQDLKNQRYEIMSYADKNDFSISSWVEIKVSSQKSTKVRLIDTLLEQLKNGDTLIVAELSRLGTWARNRIILFISPMLLLVRD